MVESGRMEVSTLYMDLEGSVLRAMKNAFAISYADLGWLA